MEEENKELEENFLSRWSKKKSKQTQIENSNSKQTDPESSIETENHSSLDGENDKLNDEELLNKFVGVHFHPEEFIKRKRDKKNIDENISRGGDQRLKKKYYN